MYLLHKYRQRWTRRKEGGREGGKEGEIITRTLIPLYWHKSEIYNKPLSLTLPATGDPFDRTQWNIWLKHLLAVWNWANYLTSLGQVSSFVKCGYYQYLCDEFTSMFKWVNIHQLLLICTIYYQRYILSVLSVTLFSPSQESMSGSNKHYLEST